MMLFLAVGIFMYFFAPQYVVYVAMTWATIYLFTATYAILQAMVIRDE